MLDSISEQLLACQSALNQYIDEKRSIFPRLYFLSDDDLLELLGQARAGADSREQVMQTHLKKLFPGTTGVRLGPGDLSITAMCSHHGETFQLEHPVDIDCPVEVWLKNLETEMRSSLKNMTMKCVVTNSLQEQDPFTLPTQILCLAQNIRFTEQAEKAILARDLHKLKSTIEKENLYYVSADVEDESERNKRQALILQCAHYVTVIRILIEKNVTSTDDWLWQKQLRFYLMSTKEVVAKMGLAQISYSYEYLGVNTGQFVRTRLADECFLILTQSLHLGLVGNPFGPAGTGKTESVKALGGLVGRLVLIFNCDEAMDAECMGRLLTGLSLCGAWGCFDEFNRLTADTLAAVSHQLASLLAALQRKPTSAAIATLNGKQVTVSEWCGVAATMNPAGRGYGGRRTLPTALERVLRPIAMVQPRGDQLAAHLLAARCILNAETLASDLHNVFTMASSLLSAQRHYDWGLRALKAAVGSCGTALQARASHPLDSQRATVKRVLALNNMSKLTRHDADRFENILSLVFSGVPVEESLSDPITKAIEASSDNLKLTQNVLQVQKCVELYEQLQQRMGIVIVGPPGSGKTTIRRLLKNALTHQGKNIVEYIICPKAMSRDWLLGNIDHDTRQWTDGVISATALEVSNQPADVWSWVVCDGDIDPEWVEALNSVLDDNRLLTLPSGWRVQFGTNVNFIFETHSLEHASPATVSRMGVILLSEDASCDMDLLSCWMQKADVENDIAKSAVPLLYQVIKKCVQWFSSHKNDVILKLYNLTLVKQILVQFEYVTQNLVLNSARISPEEIVYEAVERSIVDIVKENSIASLHEELSTILGPLPPPPVAAGEWLSDSLFMSPRLASCEPILRACLASDRSAHLLIVGPDACAKNVLAEYIAKECNSTTIAIDCTPILEPSDIISELKRGNVVRSGGQSSASNTARVTLLVRGLHRAPVDVWGSSAIHSFLLQLIEHGGFWSRGSEAEAGGGASSQWCHAARLCVLATADSPNAVSPRLSAALAQYALNEPDDDEVLELVKVWLKQNADKNIQQKEIINLANIILAMYKEVTDIFHSRPQYKWNASHLKRWCENVKWYSPSNKDELVMAIAAEANMIFKDRLVTEEEKSRFNKISRNYLKVDNEDLYFTCKLKGDGVYMESVDYGAWHQSAQKFTNQCLSEYEQNVFGDTYAEVCSELAVLCPATARSINGGVLVCVGSSGMGRRAAALITAASLPASLFFVYHLNQFNPHFKNALASSGEGNRTLIFVGESAVSSATLANVEALRRAQSTHAIPGAMLPSVHNQHIMENIKQNLGIMICLDKQQSNLSELMEKYPILYNDAHFVWLDRWSDNTLREMPALVIQRLMKENVSDTTQEQIDSIPADGFVKIYNSLDSELLKAPCRYMNFIKSYYNIVNRKKTTLFQRQSMLSSGVEALRRARSEVATLQAEATQQESLLSEKQAKANSALDQMSATVRANTDKKEEMHALKINIESENQKLQIQKKEIENELASVEPVIAAARSAVGDLRPESLSEVRSLRAPPDVVRDVLEGVLRLMGIADTSWSAMKHFLSKRGVKEDIRCLDASQISSTALQNVQRLLEKRGASFEASTAKRASAACAPLAAWVRANVEYACALQRVQPLQAHQARLHKNLQEAEDQLSALSSGLASVDQRVSALKEQLGQHTRDAAAIEMRLNSAAETLRAAQNLLDQLAHEYTAWESDLEHIIKEISELNQRSLLAAAYIVYLPDRTEPQAREYIKVWGKLIGFKDESFSIINFLSTTEKQLKWDADGLPSDQSAVKNAVLIDQVLQTPKCGFTPLLIDPDGEGLLWLRNTFADMPVDFVSQHSEKLLTAVQYAVRLGRILFITDVDEVHDSWSMLLSGISTSNASPFPPRLVLQCRDATLVRRLSTHCASRLSKIHFTPRLDGLTDQLIHYALQQQNPEISGKSKEIKMQKANLQKQQYELQENLLRDLSSNSDILHDANLLASLNKTRETNTTICKALEIAREIERVNSEACAKYEPSAKRAALLALAVKGLSARWPLVVLSVDAVLEAFVEAVRKADTSNINHEEIVKYLTRRIIERVLLALHKKDKYIVVLYLLNQVYEDLMPMKLWQLFIGMTEVSDDNLNTSDIKKNHSWLPDECLKAAAKLKATDEDLYNRLSLQNADMWKLFLTSGDLNIVSKLRLSPFETVVCVAAIRPDSLYRAIVAFVDYILGTGAVFTSSPVQSAARCARSRPILLLAAHAADVLAAHAHDHSLVQVDVEQGVSAWQAALQTARIRGGWLVLTVAASPFTRDLQAFIAEVAESTESCNEEFRMWIVSEYRDIPPLVSNACVNVILEAPEGVKNNIMGTLSAWGNYEADPKMVRLHACLAIFHALVQERRAYIPQGWSRWYAWEWGEVSACAGAIRAGGAALCLPLYAARVPDAHDARLLSVLHARYLCTGTAPTFPVPLPTAANLQTYASTFSTLPDIDSPQLLGLPANCRVAWEKNAANNIIAVLKELNTTVSVHDKGDGVASLKALLALWKKSMSGCPLLKGVGEGAGGGAGWWGCVVGGELAAAGLGARALHARLGHLARSLAHSHASALHEVPEEWQVVWAGPSAAAAYVREFSFRARAAVARLDQSTARAGYMPSEVDLRSLLQPSRAVWALRAHTLARLGAAPDRLALVGTWGPTEAGGNGDGDGDGMVVLGLRLCGAAVCGTALSAAAAHAPPHAPAPPLALRYIQQSKESALVDGSLQVPVYSSESRDDLLFTVRTPLSRDFPRDAALLNAVALFIAPLD